MNKILPPLFARGMSNKILDWKIEVFNNKYRTITGFVNSQHVISNWTVVTSGKNVGKTNSTTIEEQALIEATARWTKKQKSGGYWLNIADIDKSKFVEPMLAQHYGDRTGKIKFPVMVDKKFNGMRQILTRHGPFTRKGEPVISAPHIHKRVIHLFEKFPNLVLDGELYNHDLRFNLNDLIKLVNKKKLTSITSDLLRKSELIVDYYVYDAYGFEMDGVEITQETKCSDRRLALTKLLCNINDIVPVEFSWANNDVEVKHIFETHCEDGYEGSIIRIDTEYQNTRTNDLLKLKPEDDSECEILSIHEGTGNWNGAAKTATVKWNNKVFDATFTGKYIDLKLILNDKKDWIHKIKTFVYLGLTGLGTPNSARINIYNCNKGDR